MNASRHLVKELITHGIIALAGAVIALIALRGLQWQPLLLFGAPVLFATVAEIKGRTEGGRRAARAFLITVGVGALIASVPQIFPKLGGLTGALNPRQDRLLSLYSAIYLVWVFGVLPYHLFVGSLRAAKTGQKPDFSKRTCYLGLIAAGAICLGLPGIFLSLGFWPVF